MRRWREYGVAAIGARKGPDSVYYGIKWMQDLEEIIIDPKRCPETAREFSSYEYEATGGAAGVRLFPTGTTTRLTRCATAERRICGIFVCDKKGEGKFVYHRDGAAAGKTGGREKVE